MKRFTIFTLFMFAVQMLSAQKSEPTKIPAFEINEKINFDGILNEDFWKKAPKISNFTQRELNYGEAVSERTEVTVAYNKNMLYIGIWCYQKAPIIAKYMNTDFDYSADDNFQIMISPFNDNRTGYLFAINPNGARTDILISGGEDGNEDWNGVWDARTSVTDSGWFAEVIIPFNTLQFSTDKVLNWALNFERDIASKNEEALWQGWSRDSRIFSVVKAGKLIGLKDIAYAKKFEFKPYLLAGIHTENDVSASYPFKGGADLNVYLLPTLKLNLTTYTDFAQVESDRIPVNLSRFSVYYPEKRQFFLEGSDLFSFYLGDYNQAFYSREIGIESGNQLPIIAGARLFGKIGKNNIGFLNIQEGAEGIISQTNNTVLRYKRDIGEQSYIGGIFTNVIATQHTNQVLGLDAVYQTAHFLRDKNISVAARLTNSFKNFISNSNALTYRLSVDYPNDLVDNFMAIGSMQKNFNPELGYIRRTDYNSYTWYFRLSPRWFTKYGVKRLALKPWGYTFYQTHSTGELESFSNETRPVGAVLKSGERFEFNFIQNYDRIDESFELSQNLSIPIGKYMMYKYELQFGTYQARRIWTFLLYNWGDFYTGSIRTFEGELGLNISKYFNVNSSYSINWLLLPEGELITNELSVYLNLAFTTRLNFTLFNQYNDLDDIMLYNIRLHWIPKIGSDFYFVYNIGYNEPIKQIDYIKPQSTDAVMKLVYRITF